MIKLPKGVQIGPSWYEMRKMNDSERHATDSLGYVSHHKAEIVIDTTEVAQSVKNTVIHEILHAIYDQYKLAESDEERVVDCMATGLCQLHKDNKKFLEWWGKL